MKKTNQLNFRADEATFAKLRVAAETVDRSTGDFVRLLVEASLRMIDEPEERVVPPIIQDVIDRHTRSATPLGVRATEQNDDIALAAEPRAKYGTKNR